MNTTTLQNCIIIHHKEQDLSDFIYTIQQNLDSYKDKNLIIDILQIKNPPLESLLLFLKPSVNQYNNKKSFILINDSISIDEVPEELRLAPTIQEGIDMIEMEEIERDLGFL